MAKFELKTERGGTWATAMGIWLDWYSVHRHCTEQLAGRTVRVMRGDVKVHESLGADVPATEPVAQ